VEVHRAGVIRRERVRTIETAELFAVVAEQRDVVELLRELGTRTTANIGLAQKREVAGVRRLRQANRDAARIAVIREVIRHLMEADERSDRLAARRGPAVRPQDSPGDHRTGGRVTRRAHATVGLDHRALGLADIVQQRRDEQARARVGIERAPGLELDERGADHVGVDPDVALGVVDRILRDVAHRRDPRQRRVDRRPVDPLARRRHEAA